MPGNMIGVIIIEATIMSLTLLNQSISLDGASQLLNAQPAMCF
jgi:hypothetical protein